MYNYYGPLKKTCTDDARIFCKVALSHDRTYTLSSLYILALNSRYCITLLSLITTPLLQTTAFIKHLYDLIAEKLRLCAVQGFAGYEE